MERFDKTPWWGVLMLALILAGMVGYAELHRDAPPVEKYAATDTVALQQVQVADTVAKKPRIKQAKARKPKHKVRQRNFLNEPVTE